LSARGRARANALVAHFAAIAKKYKVKIGAVFAQRSALDVPGRKGPTSKRPVDTVVPLAKSVGTTVSKFWPDDYSKMVSEIMTASKTAVICWEHDALTDVAKAFGVALKWPDGRYDVTYVITWNAAGKASISEKYQNLLPGDMNEGGGIPPSIFIVPCDHEKKPSPKTTAEQGGWKKWFSSEYALQYGGIRTVVAQKGCQSEIEPTAKYLEAKFVDKLEKPKDVSAAAVKAKRENGVVLIVAERSDIGKIMGQLDATETAYPSDGAAVTFHLFYKGKKPAFQQVSHTK